MKRGELKISINTAWAKKVKRADFIKNLEKAYPDTDLGELYDEIVGRKPAEKAEEKKV